jgi:hypothetical protein
MKTKPTYNLTPQNERNPVRDFRSVEKGMPHRQFRIPLGMRTNRLHSYGMPIGRGETFFYRAVMPTALGLNRNMVVRNFRTTTQHSKEMSRLRYATLDMTTLLYTPYLVPRNLAPTKTKSKIKIQNSKI